MNICNQRPPAICTVATAFALFAGCADPYTNVAREEFNSEIPCMPRPGMPKPWEVISCGGNSLHEVTLAPSMITLFHNSVDASYQGGIGFGWRLGLRVTLTVQSAGDVVIMRGDGATSHFAPNGGGGWVPEPGLKTRLSRPSASVLVERFSGGTKHYYEDPNGTGAGSRFFLTRIEDRNGNVTRIVRNAQDQETSVMDPFGITTTLVWSGGRLVKVIDAESRSYQLFYNAAGDLTSVQLPQAGSVTPGENFEYDAAHRIIVRATTGGLATQYAYHPNGALARITTPHGHATRYDYTHDSVVQTTSLRERTRYVFNANGELVAKRRSVVGASAEDVEAYAYDTRHNVIAARDALGRLTTYTYNAMDDMTSASDALGNQTTLTYDDRHNVLSRTENGLTWTYTYDPFDQVLTEMNPLGEVTTHMRDTRGNLLRTTDHWGSTRYKATYDTRGLVLTETDEFDRTTTHTYDAYGHRDSSTDPLRGTSTMSVNKMGFLTTMIDPLGYTITRTPDGLDREIWSSNGKPGQSLSITVETAYDVDGRRTGMRRCVGAKCLDEELAYAPATGLLTRRAVNGMVTQDGACPVVAPPAPPAP